MLLINGNESMHFEICLGWDRVCDGGLISALFRAERRSGSKRIMLKGYGYFAINDDVDVGDS